MRKYLQLCACIFLLLATSCLSKKKLINNEMPDGSSFEKAIIINETHEQQGIHDEYLWLDQNYPSHKNLGQALTYHDKKPYDILHINTSDNKNIDVYFYIGNFFGKL